jgi:phosphoglycolate phosphatase-like HAD superfamily hydrolase
VNTWPSPFIVYLMRLLNICSSSVLFSRSESEMCTIGTIDMYTIQYQRIAELSNAGVEYAIVTSSEDSVQVLFTNAVLASVGSPAITPMQNFGLMKRVFNMLNRVPNFVVYIKNGVDHRPLLSI